MANESKVNLAAQLKAEIEAQMRLSQSTETSASGRISPSEIKRAASKAASSAGYSGASAKSFESGFQQGYNEIAGGAKEAAFEAGRRAGRAARLAEFGVQEKKPSAGKTGLELIQDHFSVPHSGNDGGPFCQFGQVWFDHESQAYILGLQFHGGKRFIYPNQTFSSADAVVASVQGYPSMSWATNPRSRYFDSRFGRGQYRSV